MWEFRDAVAAAGHYSSGADAMNFYKKLAEEIGLACTNGMIPCFPPRATMLPPFRPEYLAEARQSLKTAAKTVLTMSDGPAEDLPSIGPEEGVAVFADTADGVYLPERQTLVVHGWAAALSATPKVELVSSTSDEFRSKISVLPATDVVKVFPKFQSMRFEFKTDCPISNCEFVLDVPGTGQTRIPLAKLTQHGGITGFNPPTGLMVYVDYVGALDAYRFQRSRRALQEKIADRITSVYAQLFPILAGLGAVGLVLATFFRRRCPLPIALLARGLASAAAVTTLIVLMAYASAASGFGVLNVLYTSPASPFVITYATLGVYSWYIALKQWALRGAK